jgi:hypothetical protein
MQWLPGLDQNVRSPIFNVKRPTDKTDDEVVAEVEKKVVQMIGNFTHKEWECAQRILKHQGRVNCVFDEMGVAYSPRPVPPTASKKMQPPGNIGSEPVETSRKTKSSKTTVTVDNVVKSTKAQDILAKRKADAAKATLPLLAKNLQSYQKLMRPWLVARLRRRKWPRPREKRRKFMTPPLLVMQIRNWLRRRGLRKLRRGETCHDQGKGARRGRALWEKGAG